jgi:N-acyl-D-amino-acid deacylase
MRTLAALLAGVVLTSPACADDSPDSAVKTAVEKALKRIEAGLTNYPKHRQCFSCHHQAMAVFSMTAARKHGIKVDEELLKKQIAFSLKTFRNKTAIAKGRAVGGESTSVVYALQMLATVDRPYDETTAAMVNYLLVRQSRDGSWARPAFGDRPPTMGSLFTNTGLAMLVLKKYGPPEDAEGAKEQQAKIDAAFARGRDWLLANKPVSTEDKVFRLRGLVDAGVAAKEIAAARDVLLKEQLADGSWAQLADKPGDVYATATVLVALRRAGLDVGHEAYKKGVKYLLDAQKEDGAWIVQTRSRPLQPFFDNGDAGGKSQFISFASTNWAVLALLETLPLEGSEKDKPAGK